MSKSYLVALLLTVCLFSTFNYLQYARVLTEKQMLSRSVDSISNQLNFLLKNRGIIRPASYSLPLERGTVYIKDPEANKKIRELQMSLVLLKEENQRLKRKVAELGGEESGLQGRPESLKELKKATRNIEKEMRSVKSDIRKTIDTIESYEGNKGYLTLSGDSTFQEKVNIKVIPIDSNHN